MLPRLPLDDRTYAEIVQQTRKLIPKRLPEWTDENAHDPGITMLELFAWLTEMQRYYLSRVPDRNRKKFLDLLGVQPRDTASAEALVRFSGVREHVTLPKGTKLLAEDQVFETLAKAELRPLMLERILCRTERESSDVTASNDHLHVSFYPFGSDAKSGSKLYISFDRELQPDVPVALTFKLLRSDESLKDIYDSASEDELTLLAPSAKLSWKAYGWDEAAGKAAWTPLEVLSDETRHLTVSGTVRIALSSPMRSVTVHPAGDRPRFWFCCTVEEEGYEMPPKISSLMLHTAHAVQRDTLCEYVEAEAAGEELEAFVMDSYLAAYGDVRLQIEADGGGWIEQSAQSFAVDRSGAGHATTVRLMSGSERRVLPAGRKIRLIASTPDFYRYRMAGRSNGLPNQSFELYELPCRKRNAIGLQVGRLDSSGKMVWEDWSAVDGFDRSGPGDRHYIYRPEERTITFGNGERGAIPEACPDDNISLIACELGGGERGNVKPGLIREWAHEDQRKLGIEVSNPFYAAGGSEAETLNESLTRAASELKVAFRAVTDEDYEVIARQTPGVEVARAKAIPLYKPGLSDYPKEKAHGQLSLVVVPEGLSPTPMPSPGFLQTVSSYLEPRRLVTTELHVIPPVYVKVTVHAVIVVEPPFADETERFAALLKGLLRPLDGKDGERGWTFGRTVYKGDIYGALTKGSGVVFVQDLWLDAEGPHVSKSAGGDIVLPPHGLVYSGEHEIELISRTRL
ncbi:putative baseplate assembly protein [Paenibacillus sp. LHD-117]|uniref:putative baseplate assembly protein n=1 Tax=Paenibacillus sp. LHD-117 TaxID=3071412 RepID=UPI0027DF9981|nr:putative baseplate assembly protein [Paenibacillus sp. LHD-117]MDQ6423031.1 putative baseplate assembly protein [Paenibacillus sp. LHD-117]